MDARKPISFIQKEYAKLLKDFAREAKVETVNFFRSSFRKQGFTDKVFIPWRARKGENNARRFGQGNRTIPGRAILVKSGDLSRSIKGRVSGLNIIASSDVPYAQAHNQGAEINHPGGTPYILIRDRQSGQVQPVFISKEKAAGRKGVRVTKPHKIPIPKRQFMGFSQVLFDELRETFLNRVQKQFN